jgi:hypothetical protein
VVWLQTESFWDQETDSREASGKFRSQSSQFEVNCNRSSGTENRTPPAAVPPMQLVLLNVSGKLACPDKNDDHFLAPVLTTSF